MDEATVLKTLLWQTFDDWETDSRGSGVPVELKRLHLEFTCLGDD